MAMTRAKFPIPVLPPSDVIAAHYHHTAAQRYNRFSSSSCFVGAIQSLHIIIIIIIIQLISTSGRPPNSHQRRGIFWQTQPTHPNGTGAPYIT